MKKPANAPMIAMTGSPTPRPIPSTSLLAELGVEDVEWEGGDGGDDEFVLLLLPPEPYTYPTDAQSFNSSLLASMGTISAVVLLVTHTEVDSEKLASYWYYLLSYKVWSLTHMLSKHRQRP
jgi:hypothetical protein